MAKWYLSHLFIACEYDFFDGFVQRTELIPTQIQRKGKKKVDMSVCILKIKIHSSI